MWRHEDVWRTLGGGIDFITGERIEDEHQMSRDRGGGGRAGRPRARPAHARRRAVGHPRRADPGHHVGAAPAVRPARGVGGRRALPDRHHRDHRRRHGPPADRRAARDGPTTPPRSSPSRRPPPCSRRSSRTSSSSCCPNLFISEAVGSSESGFNGMRLVEKGDDGDRRRAHQRDHGSRHDRDRRGRPAGAARRDRSHGPRRQRARSATTRTRRRPPRPSSRSTASATRCPATSPASSSTAR